MFEVLDTGRLSDISEFFEKHTKKVCLQRQKQGVRNDNGFEKEQ